MIINWNDYQRKIDDSNIDCWMLLITWCDPFIHSYISPYDLISNVLDNIWRPTIDRCDMVSQIPGMVPGALLRVDNAGNCVEWVNPSAILSAFNTDEMVSVAGADAPGYLLDKVMSSDGSISITNLGWKLNLTSSAVSTFLQLTDTPSSYSGHDGDILKVSWSNIVFAEDDKSQRAVRYLTDDEMLTISLNTDTWLWLHASYWEGNGSMLTIDSWIPSITIKKTWMYHIRMNWGFNVNAWVNAAKIALVSDLIWDKQLLLNSKIWSDPSGHPIPTVSLWETHRYFSFSESGLVKLTAWTKLWLQVRVSSHVWSWATVPTAITIVEWKSLVSGNPNASSNPTYSHKYCWTLFGVSRYSDVTHNAV